MKCLNTKAKVVIIMTNQSRGRHARKTAFSVIVYSLSFKYSSVCDMYFLG